MSTFFIQPWHEYEICKRAREKFGEGCKVTIHCPKGSWYHKRHVKFSSSFKFNCIHYEYGVDYSPGLGYVELHIEDRSYIDVARYLQKKTLDLQEKGEICWKEWWGLPNGRCRYRVPVEDSYQSLFDAFKRMREIFEPLLIESINIHRGESECEPYNDVLTFDDFKLSEQKVDVFSCNLREVFDKNLVIPDYQRDYCWEDDNIKTFCDAIKDVHNDYHLGTIILQRQDNEYHVIDGQQRLVTLTILLRAIGYKGQLPLLKQSFKSTHSREHIANAKFLIGNFSKKVHDIDMCNMLAEHLTFSVLVLQDSNLDLAYTFFSNQNSRGVPLSDYDLLKAHHLRYIPNVAQAEHLAEKWNRLNSEKVATDEEGTLATVLGTHLYRLRKWMRKHTVDVSIPRRVKEEYSAAKQMASIPAFGESFFFYEKIQGGTHFFVYAEHFVNIFHEFEETQQVKSLRKEMAWGSHRNYASVIETILFCYFLKFGKQYLSEALFCISSVMAQHRYTNERAISYKVREFARDSELVMMIDQASSPTFFIAEAMEKPQTSTFDIDFTNVQRMFYSSMSNMLRNLNDFTDSTIKQIKDNEY